MRVGTFYKDGVGICAHCGLRIEERTIELAEHRFVRHLKSAHPAEIAGTHRLRFTWQDNTVDEIPF